jgi:hypothetical protein
LKVAFDENMPRALVRMFQILAKEKQFQDISAGLDIRSSVDYTPRHGDPDYSYRNDAPWISRFAADGGRAIISGNTRMKSQPHERLALVQSGLVTIFFESQWSQWRFFKKCSLLLHWWPEIISTVKKAPSGTFWHIPAHWSDGALRQVSSEDQKLVRVEQQKSEREVVRAKRRRLADETQGTLPFDESGDAKR